MRRCGAALQLMSDVNPDIDGQISSFLDEYTYPMLLEASY